MARASETAAMADDASRIRLRDMLRVTALLTDQGPTEHYERNTLRRGRRLRAFSQARMQGQAGKKEIFL